MKLRFLLFSYDDPTCAKFTGGAMYNLELISRLVGYYGADVHLVSTDLFAGSLSQQFLKKQGMLDKLTVTKIKVSRSSKLRIRFGFFTLASFFSTLSQVTKYKIKSVIAGGQDSPVTLLPAVALKLILRNRIKLICFPQLPVNGARQRVYAMLMRRADVIAVPTEVVADSLQEHLGLVNIRVMGCGFTLSNSIPKTARKDVDCVFVGRFTKEKGALDVIEISRVLKEAKPDLRFAVIGEVSKDIATSIPNDNSLELKGFVPRKQLYEYLARSKVFVYPSRYESFALVVAEAMDMALPIVVWDIAPFNQEFKGSEGVFFVKPFDRDAFASQILRLLSQPELRMHGGVANRGFVQRFNWDTVAENWNQLLIEAARKEDNNDH